MKEIEDFDMDPPPTIQEAESGWSALKKRLRWLFLENPETDERFRNEIVVSSVRGVRISCWLATVILLYYLGDNILIEGRQPTWVRGVGDSISILDKVVMLLIIALTYASTYIRLGRNHARLILGAAVVIAGYATVLDDFYNQNTDFSTGWVALILMLAIGTMPYRVKHTLVLGVIMWGIYPIVLTFGPSLLNRDPLLMEDMQRVFMGIMVIFGVGISGTLYRSRYRSFAAREGLMNANAKISEQTERLQELDRLKARFFANLSHEFRTPLTLIQGPVEDALQGHSGPISHRLSEHLKIAKRNGARLRRLIDQLLDLSRLEAGRLELNEGMYDLVQFVGTLVSSFSSLAETKSIQLTFETDRQELETAFDADKIEKVVTNLISNAIKFTPEKGKVLVSVGEENGFATISVKDTGPGIPKAQIPLVFERFHQVDGIDSDVQAGTGIGLAIVRELTALHGGTVELESQEGFGTTFMINLPIKKVAGETGTLPESDTEDWSDYADIIENDVEAEPLSEDAPLVLIADDHDDVRAYLRSHLESRYRITEARDGNEVLQLMEAELPALVLSDVMMPGRNGHEVCRAIKSDPRTDHIPVVLVTARASDESRQEGLRSGADDYLFKPFNASDLMVRVENLIEIRRVLKEHYGGGYALEPSKVEVKSADAEYMERLQAVVEEHIGDSNFGVDWLASEVGISARQLQRRVRSYIGLSAAGFIRTLRLKRAVQLLEGNAGTVAEIAYQVGFTDPNYFSRLFKQTFDATPSEFMKGAAP